MISFILMLTGCLKLLAGCLQARTEFGLMERAFGITFDICNVIFDRRLRTIYSVIDNTYYDPMHVLLASGGVAAFEVNAFIVHAVTEHNLDLDDLAAFKNSISFPWQGQLKGSFFKARNLFCICLAPWDGLPP